MEDVLARILNTLLSSCRQQQQVSEQGQGSVGHAACMHAKMVVVMRLQQRGSRVQQHAALLRQARHGKTLVAHPSQQQATEHGQMQEVV